MPKNKQLYYEIIDDEQSADGKSHTDGGENLPAEQTSEQITPTRDPYRELIAVAGKIERARFRVVPDNRNNLAALTLITFAIILAGCVLLYISKNKIGSIVICSIMIVGVVISVAAMIVNTVQARKQYFCYYFRTEAGAVCISYVGADATVFISSDRAYRIEDDNFYTLSADAYIDYLDGEGAGIFSVLAAKEGDVELIDGGGSGEHYFVKNKLGGGHEVRVDDGRIVSIASAQPYKTDVVDSKTGEAKIKTKLFHKLEMTDDFTVELPDGIKLAFRGLGLDVDGLITKL